MQCTRNLDCFAREKASSHSTALPSFIYFLVSLRAVFSRFHTTCCAADSFTTDGYTGSLTCAPIWVRAVHTKGGSGTNKSAQELTRRGKTTVFRLAL